MSDQAVNLGSPSIVLPRKVRRRGYHRVPKRILDLSIALLITPFLLPIIALLWVSIRLDGGPGFFGHVRVGRDRKPFRCWKLRTMVVDADVRLAAHLAADPAAAAAWARDYKLDDDPRVTKLGAFLRRSSLDELPQLWNVLRGEMSFVGPRPIVTAELERYGIHRRAYLAMRPGVTGIWQVSGRNDVSYDERIRMDVDYLRRVGLLLDLWILVRTAGAVVNRTGK